MEQEFGFQVEIRVGRGFSGPRCHRSLSTRTSLLLLPHPGEPEGDASGLPSTKTGSPWLHYVNFKGQPTSICSDADPDPRSFWKPDDLNSSLARSPGPELQTGSRRPQTPPPRPSAELGLPSHLIPALVPPARVEEMTSRTQPRLDPWGQGRERARGRVGGPHPRGWYAILDALTDVWDK